VEAIWNGCPPRARVRTTSGVRLEWRSQTVARYERRSRRVDIDKCRAETGGHPHRAVGGALNPFKFSSAFSIPSFSRQAQGPS
jgi:hypothetical protein